MPTTMLAEEAMMRTYKRQRTYWNLARPVAATNLEGFGWPRAISRQLSAVSFGDQRSAPLTRLRRNELNQKLSRGTCPDQRWAANWSRPRRQAMVDICLVPLCPSFSMTSAAAMY